MVRRLFLTVLAVVLLSQFSLAGDCCQPRCPRCNHACVGKVEVVTVDKHCWEVECKQICIPRVRFPWEKSPCSCKSCGGCGCGLCCPPPQCAKVKTVHDLEKVEYECQKCEYSWEAVPCCNCGYNGCGHSMAPEAVLPIETLPDAVPQPPIPSAGKKTRWWFW